MLCAFVQSTRLCAGTEVERSRLKAIHVDAGRNGTSQTVDDTATCNRDPEDIVIFDRADRGDARGDHPSESVTIVKLGAACMKKLATVALRIKASS
jgi:hypothetical protein